MLINEIAQLEIKEPESKGILKILISKEEKQLGKIIILVKLAEKIGQGDQLVKRIINEAKYSYYESPTDNPETALENALQKVNFLISHIVKEEGKEWLAHLSMLIAVTKDAQIHFSKVGFIRAFLVQGHKMNDIAGSNIFEDEINPIKAFSNILSGEIAKDNIILFCTESILDYISQDKLRKTVLDYAPHSAREHIQKLLENAPSQAIFSALILKRVLKTSDAKIEPTVKHKSEDEVPALIEKTDDTNVPQTETKKGTGETLANNHIVDAKKDQEESEEDTFVQKHSHPSSERMLLAPKQNPLLGNILKSAVAYVRTIADKSDRAIKMRKDRVKTLTEAIKTPIERKKAQTHKTTARNGRNGIHAGIIGAAKIGVPLLIVLAIGSFLIRNIQKQKAEIAEQKAREEYFVLVGNIKDKLNEAIGTLIYQDKDKAKNILLQTKNLIESLPEKTPEQKTVKEDLIQQNDEYYQLALGIKVLRGLTPLFDFATLNQELSPNALILDGNTLYTFSSANNAIYAFDVTSKKGEKLAITSSGVGALKTFVGKVDEELIFYEESGGLAGLNLASKKIIKKEIDRSFKTSVLAVYSNKIYSLDTALNKIYKHNKTLTGFSKGDEWLKDSADLSGAVSMSIDSTVWVLTQNGGIQKLFKGAPSVFPLSLEPSLKTPLKIDSSTNETSLIVPDPGTSRLIFINKSSGQTESQYMFPELNNLRDFTVRNLTAYILDGTKIYEFNLDKK
ncbi:MAG: hypothetical protein UW24_C0001G0021 [Parcubacteria group bacterium GW2011_GWA2_44_12]|nr:MAG: hypothetical protein UW24_C0001G0021 [Parcubacteria group bacterium GW2011_GWA2_44_12]